MNLTTHLAVPYLGLLVAGFEPRSGPLGFLVDKVTEEQDFSEYFGFPCQLSFHRLLHIHHHHLSSWAGTIGHTVADVPSGLSLIPPREKSNHSLPTSAEARITWIYTSAPPYAFIA
jgi:hypothetical protein